MQAYQGRRRKMPGMRTSDGALEYSLRVLRRRKFVILASLIVVTAIVFAYEHSQTKEYKAAATLLFENKSEPGVTEASREAATNEALAALPAVALKASKALGSEADVGEVLGSVTVESTNEQANLTAIEVTNPSPTRAAEIANAYANAYIAFRRGSDKATVKKSIAVIEKKLEELSPEESEGAKGSALRERLGELEVEEALATGDVSLVQEASAPTSPSTPRTKRDVILAALVGLVLGLALAAIFERLDTRIRSVEELEEVFGVPIIARIPKTKNFRRTRVAEMLRTPEAESLRGLRTNMRYLGTQNDLSALLIASPEPADGKSTVARALAGAMVEMGDNVVLVEADLHKESAFKDEPGGRGEGLSGVLIGTDVGKALIRIPIPAVGKGDDRSLAVLPSGPVAPNPSELLESDRMREVMADLREKFDTVIVDSPAVGIVSDAMALVPLTTAIIAVGGIGKTKREPAERFVDQLNLTGNRPIGLVATLTSSSRGQYSYYRQSMILHR
jgi:capsular exopolysaccharide synthesis family protein